MPDNIKDFIIFCTNTKEEIVKLRVKNMPDEDERQNIILLRKQMKYVFRVLSWMEMLSTIVFFVSLLIFMFGFNDVMLGGCYPYFGVFGICSFICILIYYIFDDKIKNIIVILVTKNNGCEYIRRNIEKDTAAACWGSMEDTLERAYTALELLQKKTPEGTPLYTDPGNSDANIVITFNPDCFVLDCTSCAVNGDQIKMCGLFFPKLFIVNYGLEEDTVEYDFEKNECRVPLGYL